MGIFKKQKPQQISHNAYVVDSIEEFIKFIFANTKYDKKHVMVYLGKASILAGIVKAEYSLGEKDIPHLSLVYVDFDRVKNDCIMLGDSFLEPCKVLDLKKEGPAKRIRYSNNEGKYIEFKKAVICDENIYLTAK